MEEESSKIFVGAIRRSWGQVSALSKIKGFATADSEVGDGGIGFGTGTGPKPTKLGVGPGSEGGAPWSWRQTLCSRERAFVVPPPLRDLRRRAGGGGGEGHTSMRLGHFEAGPRNSRRLVEAPRHQRPSTTIARTRTTRSWTPPCTGENSVLLAAKPCVVTCEVSPQVHPHRRPSGSRGAGGRPGQEGGTGFLCSRGRAFRPRQGQEQH